MGLIRIAPRFLLAAEREGPEVDPRLTPRLENWDPHPVQRLAMASTANEVFFGGARGGGKSDWLIADFAAFAEEYRSAAKGLLVRRTIGEFRQLQDKAREMFVGRAEWHATDRRWIFKNGAFLIMGHLDTMDDVANYMGNEYTWMGFDELTEWPSGEPYEYMGTFMRSTNPEVPKLRRSTGNPGRPGHAWIKDYFIDRVAYGDIYTDPVTGRTRQFIPSRLTDNPHLTKNKDYINELMSLSPVLRKAFLWGDWNVFLGQAFPEWRMDKHVVPAQLIRPQPYWKRWASCDWGTNKPYAILFFAASPMGRIYVYREVYGQKPHAKPNTGTHESAALVAAREWGNITGTGCESMIFDPSMDGNLGNEVSLAQQFRDKGWDMIKGAAGPGARVRGKGMLHTLLQTNLRDGYPTLQVSTACPHLIRTFPALPYATKGVGANEDVDTDAEDHLYDALRYSAMSDVANSPANFHQPNFAMVGEEQSQWNPNDPQWYGEGWAERDGRDPYLN